MAAPKILIVDRYDPMRKLGKEEMEEAGWEVRTAATRAEALEIFETEKDFSLVTLDIFLPDDGVRLLHALLEKRRGRKPLIFVLATHDLQGLDVLKADEYIIKTAHAWVDVLKAYEKRVVR